MASSIPAAITFLYDQASLLPECADPVEVTDSRPGDAAVWFSIGVDAEDDETETELVRADLAGRTDLESPVVPCMVRARASDRNPDLATRKARVAAFTIFDAFTAMIHANPRLGGLLSSDAGISDFRVRQTNAKQQTGDGRVCRIYFSVTWKNFL